MVEIESPCETFLGCKKYMDKDKGTDKQHMKVKTVEENIVYKAMSFKLTMLSTQNKGKMNTLRTKNIS